MGKNKLKKFAEMELMPNVHQFPWGSVAAEGCPLKGRWSREVFGNNAPIVLELGCGKGEYTVGLGRMNPEANHIGIDIKGARMYTGARQALREGLHNVAFLRTSIELLDRFFAQGEVSEIWITFPDPQMKKATKRLTGSRMLELYRKVLGAEGRVTLKTDSPFLYAYTRMLLAENGLKADIDLSDVYADVVPAGPANIITTHYERQWLQRGLTSKLLSWRFPAAHPALHEPAEEPEPDTYRSYGRGVLQGNRPTESETIQEPEIQ